jgi:hypothetical protein
LARNFYWLNTTRFYSGCYSKGELPSLVDRLEALAADEAFRRTSHPRTLAQMLLSDWVFAQNARSMRKVIAIALTAVGSVPLNAVTDMMKLPTGSGRAELAERCWELLEGNPNWDRRLEIAQTLRANASPPHLDAEWLARARGAVRCGGNARAVLLQLGQYLGSLARVGIADVCELFSDSPPDVFEARLLLHAGKTSLVERSDTVVEAFADDLLMGQRAVATDRAPRSLLDAFSQSLGLAIKLGDRDNALNRAVLQWWVHGGFDEAQFEADGPLLRRVHATTSRIQGVLQRTPPAAWSRSLTPWESLVQMVREEWGERQILLQYATLAAGVRTNDEVAEQASNLFDDDVPLCGRARFARLRAGSGVWWSRQLREARLPKDRLFIGVIFFAWAGPTSVRECAAEFDDWLGSVDTATASAVQRIVARASTFDSQLGGRPLKLDVKALPTTLHPRTILCLAPRCDDATSVALYHRFLERATGQSDERNGGRSDSSLAAFCVRMESKLVESDPERWGRLLDAVADAYRRGFMPSIPQAGRRWTRAASSMPLEVAQRVTDRPLDYPLEVVALAEDTYREHLGPSIRPVVEVAAEQGW